MMRSGSSAGTAVSSSIAPLRAGPMTSNRSSPVVLVRYEFDCVAEGVGYVLLGDAVLARAAPHLHTVKCPCVPAVVKACCVAGCHPAPAGRWWPLVLGEKLFIYPHRRYRYPTAGSGIRLMWAPPEWGVACLWPEAYHVEYVRQASTEFWMHAPRSFGSRRADASTASQCTGFAR